MDTPKPPQNAAAQHAADEANTPAQAPAHALDVEDAPSLAIDDALARILANPPAAECPIMVLLVDDQAIIAEAVRLALAGEPGVDFHYCASPEEAVQCAETTRATVILQDLVMPGTDGLTLVRQYRQNPATRDMPIIVLSTKEEPLVKSAAFAAGANDYLVKLPDRIELIARIRYHSRSYLNLLQRDEAYRALRQSQQQLLATNLELQRLTHSDGLTGLSNRRYLDQYLTAEWRRGARDKTGLGFLMIDVDNFKAYNDTYGHVAGDEVLKSVAHTIESCLGRASDLAARFGGEEFAVVVPGTSAGGLRLLAEKIRIAIEDLAITHAGSAAGVVTISIGVASLVPSIVQPVTTLIEAADVGLYRAKRDGKNQVATSG
ncbi:diguanylate cyclase [Paraburkholderia sp. Ac-20336]|uniref:diguanylate cyclase n=1 Tax=unclassified Paraburkholderia TaxID=2615204 RepID=UPI0014210106|nr:MULTISPECIES: diguanylate cyclase [unclassified Paraburkholderia]MBN3807065.1 diguanylate cyclase [Paraburkholderia sp. Ac-20336]NIF81501.1 diguanylate cyclase [Paraburkholderia sp. Cy-641]